MNTFSERLSSAIAKARLGKSELAVRLGKAPSVISRWLRGAVPDIHNTNLLADALGVSVQWLLTGVETTASNQLREEPAIYRTTLNASDQGGWCHSAADRALNEIQQRLYAMCSASSESIRAHLQRECITRIEEFGSLCAVNP